MSVEALECTLQSLESSSAYSKLDTAAENAKTLSSETDVNFFLSWTSFFLVCTTCAFEFDSDLCTGLHGLINSCKIARSRAHTHVNSSS